MVASADALSNLREVRFADLTDQEFSTFIADVDARGISPFSPHIYTRRQWSPATERNELRVLMTIDGFRACAVESGEFAGSVGPLFCGRDWEWHEVWRGEEEFPVAAKFGALRKGCNEPCFRVARWDEFSQYNDAGELLDFWLRMPSYMLGLRAEALALRACFPQRLGAIYLPEELAVEPGRHRPNRVAPNVGSLDDTLIDMGYDSPDERKRIIARYESQWALLARNNPVEFAARVGRDIQPKRRIVPVAE